MKNFKNKVRNFTIGIEFENSSNLSIDVRIMYASYWDPSLQAYVGHPSSLFARVYVRDFPIEPGKAYYVDVNKNISFSLFGKLWWPVTATIEYLGPYNNTNDIILPLNTTIKNLRQLCDLPFMEQNREVKYWDAKRQEYRAYSPYFCEEANENIPVEPGMPYRTYANQSWKGEIY